MEGVGVGGWGCGEGIGRAWVGREEEEEKGYCRWRVSCRSKTSSWSGLRSLGSAWRKTLPSG